jgi:hypothetical protein
MLLKVVAASEAGALDRVLQVLKSHNLMPRRVMAENVAIRGPGLLDVIRIEIELMTSGVTPKALRILAARINQLPIVLAVAVGDPAATECG